jgi:hypothetical protein
VNNPDTRGWPDVLQQPGDGDHIVQVYQDRGFLAETVVEYLATGLDRGEAAIVIARPEHRELFERELEKRGGSYAPAALVMLDADDVMARFMGAEMPEWRTFHEVVGGAIATLRLQYPAVRAYGEMVDILWQNGRQEAALRLEEFWNELATLQTFSLFCAYAMDNLDTGSYGGALQCVCKVHTHLIPARDYSQFDKAVDEATHRILDAPMAHMLSSLADWHRPKTKMPAGQATLLWLRENMPRTAERVLEDVRAKRGTS